MAGRRLAFFIQDLRGGGAESTTVRLVNGLARRSIPVDLVLVGREGPFVERLDPAVRLVDLASGRTAAAVLALTRYLRRERPAALVSAMTHTNVAAIAAARAAGVGTRTVVVEHNQFDRNAVRKRGAVRLAYGLVPFAYRFANVVAAVSEGVRATLAREARLPNERIEILYNPVVTPDLEARAAQPVDHPWFADDIPVFLAVGRLTRQKNYPLMFEAIARLAALRPVRLVVLGEGEERPALEALRDRLGLAGAIDLPGFRENPFPFMRRAAALVMSSDWEGLPTVLIEALACGTPVVATDCRSGPAEILERGRLGALVPVGDAAALADALARTLADPGDPGPRIARAASFDLDRSIDRYLAVSGW